MFSHGQGWHNSISTLFAGANKFWESPPPAETGWVCHPQSVASMPQLFPQHVPEWEQFRRGRYGRGKASICRLEPR